MQENERGCFLKLGVYKSNRKPHPGFRMVPVSMILSDI